MPRGLIARPLLLLLSWLELTSYSGLLQTPSHSPSCLLFLCILVASSALLSSRVRLVLLNIADHFTLLTVLQSLHICLRRKATELTTLQAHHDLASWPLWSWSPPSSLIYSVPAVLTSLSPSVPDLRASAQSSVETLPRYLFGCFHHFL